LIPKIGTNQRWGSRARQPGGYSAGNSPAISIRGGEPWLMRYCWSTPSGRFVDIARLIRASLLAGLCYDTPHIKTMPLLIAVPDKTP